MSKLQFEQDEIESGKNHLSLKREVRTRTLLISEAQANKTRSVRRGANRVMCTWRQRRRSCRINYTWKESKSHESSAYENHLWYCTDQVQFLKQTHTILPCRKFSLSLRVSARPYGQYFLTLRLKYSLIQLYIMHSPHVTHQWTARNASLSERLNLALGKHF